MKTTKKQLEAEVKELKDQLHELRKANAGFNKYGFLRDLEDEIRRGIDNEEITAEEQINEYIDSSLDNAVIYYKDCFEIAMELNATHFMLDELGENAADICQLAYYALREYVYSEISIHELNELIEAKQNA